MSTVANTPLPALEVLKAHPQWVCFTKDKAPISPLTLKGVTGDLVEGNPSWASEQVARKVWEDHAYWIKGIGREFVKSQCITGIDLDHCIENGKISPWALYVVKLFNSYTEISPSGTGLHIWVYGSIPDNLSASDRKHDGDKPVEAYDCLKYFTVTGNHLADTPTTIENRQEQLTTFYQEVRARRDLAIATIREQKQQERVTTGKSYKSNGTAGDTPYGMKALTEDCAELASMGENSGRNDRMNAIAYKMGQYVGGRELTKATAEDRIYSAAQQCGLPVKEIEKTLYRAIEDGMRSPRSAPVKPEYVPYVPTPIASNGNGNGHHEQKTPVALEDPNKYGFTDLGNAERFAERYKDTVRWCETWNTWVVFDGGKSWEADKSGRVDQFAKTVVRAIYHEAANEPDDERRKQILKHAKASESNRAIRALLDRAKSELPITPEQFNTHLHLLNCDNGTLDLRTGELRPHSPHDFLTRCIKVKYNPLAPSPSWITFVETILSDDHELTSFMQEALGMSLSGDTSEQCLFICHGNGSNGKTTMLETIRIIMAGYGFAANIETFQVRKGEAIRNDIAELYGQRLVTASENTMGSRLNEAFIKKATGKEPLRARRLHENEFEFMPEFTLWLAVNHKPVVKDTTKGMWRRVHFIPFLKTFEEGQVDKHFGEKLLDEAEGILAWLVQGCMAWYSRGQLTIPKAVKEATQAYKSEMDMIGNFLANECDLSDKTQKAATKELLERYETWCNQLGETFNAKDLKRGLNERGRHSQRGTGGAYVYIGIRLLASDEKANTTDSEGSEGSEPKSTVSPRAVGTSQIISDLPSPTFTTFTNSSPETPEKGLGRRCATCKRNEAVVWWKGDVPRCRSCQDKANEGRS